MASGEDSGVLWGEGQLSSLTMILTYMFIKCRLWVVEVGDCVTHSAFDGMEYFRGVC